MTSFDDREKGFERKYVLDEEVAFKINARRNRLIGLWAAELLGKTKDAADAYAKDVVDADVEKPGRDNVVAKIAADFKAANIAISPAQIQAEMQRLFQVARQQVASANA
jgi:hypothetical protein